MSERAAVFYYVALLDEGGESTRVNLTDRVNRFEFTDREGGLDKLQLAVDNKDLANFDDPVFEYGARLRVAWGNGQASSAVRDVVIRKVTGGRDLTVVAVSKQGAALDTVKRRRMFEDVRRSDVVRQIARENGFRQPDIEETPEVFPSIAQANLTDGQLCKKLANLEGFEFYIDFDGLHFHRRRLDQSPIRRYRYFTDPEGGEIIDFNVTNDITRRPGKVTVKSRNPLSKEDISAAASNKEDTDRAVLAENVGIIDAEAGEITQRQEVVQETTIASNVQTQEDAVREAKGKFRKASQRAVKLTLNLRGDPALVAKSVIEVEGLGRRLSGKYYVTEIVHSLDAGGGYDMTAKCITDGFQGGRGKGKGQTSGDSSNALVAAAQALEFAALNEVAVGVDAEAGTINAQTFARLSAIQRQASGIADAARILATQQGEQLATNAARLASSASRLASAANGAGAPNTAQTANELASLCRRLAEAPADVQAQGQVNKKPVNESAVRPVSTVDADGREVTKFQKTGGREK